MNDLKGDSEALIQPKVSLDQLLLDDVQFNFITKKFHVSASQP